MLEYPIQLSYRRYFSNINSCVQSFLFEEKRNYQYYICFTNGGQSVDSFEMVLLLQPKMCR